jgi:hypothetical protein
MQAFNHSRGRAMRHEALMNRLTIAVLVAGILIFAACSSTPQKPAESKQAETAAPKTTEKFTGREAFQKMYPAGRGWIADAKPVRIESESTSDADGRDGKSAIWRVVFASPGRQKMEGFSWSGSTASDMDRGISHGTEDTFSPSNASTQPFDLNYLKIDSDQALATANKHGGDKLLKKDAKLPVQYLLDWDPRKQQLVWHVIYGKSRNSADLTIDVDATNNDFIREEK